MRQFPYIFFSISF